MTTTQSPTTLGPFCALMSSLTWAVGVSAYSKLSHRFPPSAVNFSRVLVALPLFFMVSLLFEAPTVSQGLEAYGNLTWQSITWLSLSSIASYALGDVVFLRSASILGVPAALAIASTYPFWSAIVGWAFRGEALPLSRCMGLIIVVSGTVLVILSGANKRPRADNHLLGSHSREYALGLLLAFTASLFWALNAIASAQGGAGLPSSVSNTIRMGSAFILCPTIGLFLNRTNQIVIPWRSFKNSMWVFVFEGFGGAYMFVYGLTNSTLAVGAALSSLAPVISVPIAWILGTEKFSVVKTVGITLVVTGAWLLVA